MRLDVLDWVNFLLADVRGGLGPYVNVYLLTHAHWTQETIGAVLTVSGLTGIALLPTVGAFIDHTRAKRGLLVAGTVALAGCGLAVALLPVVPVVLASDMTMAVLGGVFAPTVAAITLGMVDKKALAARLGRNAVFDRIGNVCIAGAIGLAGLVLGLAAPFVLTSVFAVLASSAILAIPAGAIDHERARGLDEAARSDTPPPGAWRLLFVYRPLLILAGGAALFFFASAPMLPLVVQKLALANPGWEASATSATILVSQGATILMALLASRANLIGRKPLMMLAFAALPLRALLCALIDSPGALLAIQVLDGIGGGLFEVLLPLVLADIMRGTGHYSLARGVVGTIQGIGGSLSQVVAGTTVTASGYRVAFLSLGGVALVALILIALAMPETMPQVERADPWRRPN